MREFEDKENLKFYTNSFSIQKSTQKFNECIKKKEKKENS